MLLPLRVIAALVLIGLTVSGCGYNAIPTLEEQAKAKWADVQTAAKSAHPRQVGIGDSLSDDVIQPALSTTRPAAHGGDRHGRHRGVPARCGGHRESRLRHQGRRCRRLQQVGLLEREGCRAQQGR